VWIRIGAMVGIRMGGGKCEDDDDETEMLGKATKGEREISYPRFRQVVNGA